MDRRLKVFVGLNANISCLEGPGCWSTITTKDAGCVDGDDDLCSGTFAISVGGCGAATLLGSTACVETCGVL